MKKILLGFCFLGMTSFFATSQTWTVLNSSAPANATFRAISAPTASYVIAAGNTSTNGRLFAYTSDGGSQWTHPTNVWTPANTAIKDLIVTPGNFVHHAMTNTQYTQASNFEFGGGNDGYAGGYGLTTGSVMNRMAINGPVKVMVGKDGNGFPLIAATQASNGNWGYNWPGEYNGTDTWNNVFNIGSNTWVIGNNGKLNKNTDGFQTYTWADINTGVTNNLNGIYFINANLGFIVGSGGVILKTTNGGTSWTSSTPSTHDLHAVTFVNSTDGWAVGANGTILRTTNAGNTWAAFSSPTSQTLYDFEFFNPFVGYAAGANGTIIKFQEDCSDATSFSAVSCGPYAWVSQEYTQSGTYTQNFSNQFGCDSTVTLSLTVHPYFPPTELNISACESYTSNGQIYTQSGQYLDTLTSVLYGCDSVVVLNITISSNQVPNILNIGSVLMLDGIFNTIQWVDCNANFEAISGALGSNYTPLSNGSYAVITSSGSCPADTSDCVQFCAGVNLSVSQTDGTLTVQQSGANYQWLDCDNNFQPISEALAQSFTPTSSGSYAVEVTINGCTTSSSCIAFTIGNPVGIEESNENISWMIYPNPAQRIFYISGLLAGNQITVLDLSGKVIFETLATGNLMQIESHLWQSGVYFIQLRSSDTVQRQKLVLQK